MEGQPENHLIDPPSHLIFRERDGEGGRTSWLYTISFASSVVFSSSFSSRVDESCFFMCGDDVPRGVDPGERATSGIYEKEDAERAEAAAAGRSRGGRGSGGGPLFSAQGLKANLPAS